MQALKNRLALVTGGVSGIGFGIARALLERGARVVVTFRSEAHRDAAMPELRRHGQAKAIYLDVTDRAAVAGVAQDVESAMGPVDILCNNAGVNLFEPLESATFDDWDWVLGVNLGGVINMLVSFLPQLMKHDDGAHILNVGSMASFISGPQAGLYTTSKFALRGLTECLRYSLARHRIRVSLLAPGLTATNIHEAPTRRPDAFDREPRDPDPETLERVRRTHGLGMSPIEVGRIAIEGMLRNDMYIFSHPEFRQDLEDLHREIVAALPTDADDARRRPIETRRRESTAAARVLADSLSL